MGMTERFAKPSPLMNIAAVSVVVASLTAVAAITGVIPVAHSDKADTPIVAAKPAEGAGADSGDRADKGRFAANGVCNHCGVVESIRVMEAPGQATGLGAVAGGVTGALVGNQVGRGNGRTAMTVLGAAGGAYAGHAIEKNVRKSTVYRVAVRMEDGAVRTISQSTQPAFAVGEKVKLINGALVARS